MKKKKKLLMLSEDHQRHQELFKERRRWAGFCRWMASRYRGIAATIADKPHPKKKSDYD
jgi:hypothetical protein